MDGGDQVVQKNFPIDVCGEHLDLDHEVDVDVGDVKKRCTTAETDKLHVPD